MAGMLAAYGRLCLVSFRARSLQKLAFPGQRKQALLCSLRISPALQPHNWQSPAVRGTLLRSLSTSAPSQPAQVQNTSEKTKDFKLIYRFPGIKYCRAISRLKLLQTAITVLILPPVWFLYWQNQVTQAQCLYSTGIACFAGIMLYAMSCFLRRIIGLMYLNKDGTVLQVAHLTFWGRRNDIYCPVETVMTLDDTNESHNNVLIRFQQYNGDRFLYFTLRFGQVLDKEGFENVFGRI